MRILVLGGTGAMGVELVKILAARGEELIVTSRSVRESEWKNVRYIQGDAHDMKFLKAALGGGDLDAIVDFMVYATEEFALRRDLLLNATAQYIFLSSSRVYADSEMPIREDSPRLLDVIRDEAYLRTDEYALAKARQEDLLYESGKQNWTIVRPYITYNSERLQLGVYEKELWLYRALHGQTIVFSRDIAGHMTTLTWGKNVAEGIAALAGNSRALGKPVHITTKESICWNEVLELYQRVFREVTGKPMKVKWIDSSERIGRAKGGQYQIKYDRLFNRTFDHSEIMLLTNGSIDFVSPRVGLERCLRSFLEKPRFREISARAQAWMDLETRERTPLFQFNGYQNRMKYMIGRYTPYFKIHA